jgi:hypothetical protein
MSKDVHAGGVTPRVLNEARSATGTSHGAAAEVKRWPVGRKKEVVSRRPCNEQVNDMWFAELVLGNSFQFRAVLDTPIPTRRKFNLPHQFSLTTS